MTEAVNHEQPKMPTDIGRLWHRRFQRVFNDPPPAILITNLQPKTAQEKQRQSFEIQIGKERFEVNYSSDDWDQAVEIKNPEKETISRILRDGTVSPQAEKNIIEDIFKELRKGYPPFTVECKEHGIQPVDPLDVNAWSREAAQVIDLEEYFTANCPQCNTTITASRQK